MIVTEWILEGAVGVCIVGLIFTLRWLDRRRLRRLLSATEEREAKVKADIDALGTELGRMREDASRLEDAWAATREAPRPSLNFRRRAQVLRLARRGESSAAIASNLGFRKAEVDLMLRVYELSPH